MTAQTFQTYTSSTLNATVGAPDAESAVCLGCHDGQTALNAYGATPYPTAVKLSDPGVATNSNSITGTDLTNDHPVSFTFDNTLYTADGTLKDPATGSVSALLRNSKVQCSSCHDPHGKVGLTKFLRVTMANSALCTTCHNK